MLNHSFPVNWFILDSRNLHMQFNPINKKEFMFAPLGAGIGVIYWPKTPTYSIFSIQRDSKSNKVKGERKNKSVSPPW